MELGVGDTLLLSLESTPGTGFDWNLSSPPTSMLELAERTVTPSGTLPGGPATVTYRFRAAAAGEATLSLGYARSWESVPPVRTFELNVRVRQ
jgi:predicted secreted protein